MGPVKSIGGFGPSEVQRELGAAEIERLVAGFLLSGTSVPNGLYDQLARYLELLLKWNARTNLTAIRKPDDIVRRHFGESLFGAQHLGLTGAKCETLLDFGSGAGFPGLPIQLLFPGVQVTLAESQSKKASFLREAVRVLGVKTEVWAGRVESMPAGRRFDVVTLRAVDRMDLAIEDAVPRVGRRLLLMTTTGCTNRSPTGLTAMPRARVPGSEDQDLLLFDRLAL